MAALQLRCWCAPCRAGDSVGGCVCVCVWLSVTGPLDCT